MLNVCVIHFITVAKKKGYKIGGDSVKNCLASAMEILAPSTVAIKSRMTRIEKWESSTHDRMCAWPNKTRT